MNKLIDLHEQVLCCLSRLTATLVPYTSPFHSPSVDCTLQIVLELIELHETEVARFFFFVSDNNEMEMFSSSSSFLTLELSGPCCGRRSRCRRCARRTRNGTCGLSISSIKPLTSTARHASTTRPPSTASRLCSAMNTSAAVCIFVRQRSCVADRSQLYPSGETKDKRRNYLAKSNSRLLVLRLPLVCAPFHFFFSPSRPRLLVFAS